MTAKLTNATTEIELAGIKIAAIIGDNCPVTAKYKPITLYKNDINKLILTTFKDVFVNLMNLFNEFISISAQIIRPLARDGASIIGLAD